MMLQKTKRQVLDLIKFAAMAKASNSLQSNLGNQLRVDTGSVSYAIQSAIADAIEEGFSILIDNIYTDAQFEEDIGLREKNATK